MGCPSSPDHRSAEPQPAPCAGRAGIWLLLGVVLAQCFGVAPAAAQQADVHYWHQGVLGPGLTGQRQLLRGGPLPGFFQPVEIIAPEEAKVWLAAGGTFDRPRSTPLRVGLLIGPVYRIKVTHIPLQPGVEVFPTIELIDRLYAPPDQLRRFPIPIQLTREDLELALQGKYVTRVIYLEDPRQALPARQDTRQQGWFDVGPGRDPLAAADSLGRPVAILRLGARLPDPANGPDDEFLYGCPPFVEYPRQTKVLPPPPEDVAPPAASGPAGEQTAAGAGAAPVPAPPAPPASGSSGSSLSGRQ